MSQFVRRTSTHCHLWGYHLKTLTELQNITFLGLTRHLPGSMMRKIPPSYRMLSRLLELILDLFFDYVGERDDTVRRWLKFAIAAVLVLLVVCMCVYLL